MTQRCDKKEKNPDFICPVFNYVQLQNGTVPPVKGKRKDKSTERAVRVSTHSMHFLAIVLCFHGFVSCGVWVKIECF